ncbi:MAG: DUF6089 family protein [Bacteroidota bacterium]
MKIIFFLLAFCTISLTFSQRQNGKSKSEIGFLAGGSYYIGDLNIKNHFENTDVSFGGIFRYNVHSRMSLRTTFTYGNLKATDADSKLDVERNRNLSFQTDFYEFATGVEFNYLPYQTGHSKYRISPYIYAQIGVFRMNPKANYNGDLIELQPLGTEGQGTDLSDHELYSKTQICLPLGLGVKFSLSKNISFSLEYGLRKTFTDYIDDVGSSRYADRDQLSQENGPIVGDLSNRSLDGSSFGRRGNPSTKDWYFVFGGILSMRLGPPDRCFQH